jgi:hypothetical protein
MAEVTGEHAEAVRHWLDNSQFEHVSTAGGASAAFGDRQDAWQHDGALVRLTRDRGQWWCDVSRSGTDVWLDLDVLTAALGYAHTAPVERLKLLANSIDDGTFRGLFTAAAHSP